ncbi:hypothetical protein [Streptomonospora wellingtoniae]|uniref:Uncharacterized protein n=1 Tax=Streptomonospora wellingtoniae TaxID=3075544 RepID=A0ABU2KUE7_9ACTN|nr:hypothetical protein [Streptomonospora sp. DSM 45055]MDT0302877.1 hypothetical protein [Streptomonospora sp. DSM 45055]
MRRHRTGPTPEHYPNATLQDTNIDLGSKGLLLNLLAREDAPSLNILVAESKQHGHNVPRSEFEEMLDQLASHGYVDRDPFAEDDDPVATDVYDVRQRP